MKLSKQFFLLSLIICAVFILNGCVYASNQNRDDLTDEEKQEVRDELQEIKSEYEKNLSESSSDSGLSDELALYIIDIVEEEIQKAE